MNEHIRAASADEYIGLLKRSDGSLTLREFLRARPAVSDDALADMIEADGRWRVAHGEAIRLDDYLEAEPQLADFPVALDAAIDMALRALSKGSRITAEAVSQLRAAHPALAGQIERAAALSRALLSTNSLRRVFPLPVARSLPAEFGPRTHSGVRRYQLRELLGRGASAEVYLGLDRTLSDERAEALVAVKILDARDDARSRRRASAEATKARRIDHPNVVRVIDRGVSDDGDEYIVYEHVPGGSLDAWLEARGRWIPAREAARLARDIARGVQAAHIASLIHADLQPGNVLMAAEDAPKVADFGVAVEASESAHAPSAGATRRAGSIAFMSPEQYRLEPGWRSPPTDIYALGGLLHWLLTGRCPNGSSEAEIDARLGSRERLAEPPSIGAFRKDVDADLEAICQRALAPRREDRHDSAGALADDLDAWLAHEPIWWRKPSLSKIARLWARRRPVAATASLGGIAAAIVAAVVGGWITQSMLSAQSQANEQMSRSASVQGALQAFMASIARRAEAQHVESTLFELHTIESIVGQRLDFELLPEPDMGDVWIPAATRVLDSYASRGLDRSLEAGLWRTGLAMRYVALDRYDEATTEIERARSILTPLFAVKDEPILRLLDDLDRCIVVGRAVEASVAGELAPAEREALAGAADALWTRVAGGVPDGAIARQEALFAWFVEIANAPTLLDDAKRRVFARRFRRGAWGEMVGQAAELRQRQDQREAQRRAERQQAQED